MVALALLGGFVGVVVLMVVSSVLNGWALSVLWGLFMVPALGLPPLHVVPAMGIALVVGYMTYHSVDTQPKEEPIKNKIVGSILTVIFRPLFAVAVGSVIRMFM